MKCAILPVTPFRQNCTLLWDEATGEGAVCDPGGDLDAILEAAAEAEMRIAKILLTHGHLDHASGAAVLRERLGVPIEGPHEADSFWLDRLPGETATYGFPPAAAFAPDRWLADGDTVQAAGTVLDVRHCPGHTQGHVVFFHPGLRLALVGDVLFRGSVGRSDIPHGDHDLLIRSIREKLWPLGEDVTFVPGHGAPSTFGAERQANPFVADRLFD